MVKKKQFRRMICEFRKEESQMRDGYWGFMFGEISRSN